MSIREWIKNKYKPIIILDMRGTVNTIFTAWLTKYIYAIMEII